MKDIICEDCGHKESMHSMFGCEARLEDGIMCECSNSEKGVLVAHIAKLEAVVEAAMRIDFDGVANVLEEIVLDEGDESIVADIRALENILTEYRKGEA